jgi:hypothetical protein
MSSLSKDLNVIFFQNMPNLHNYYKSAQGNILQKNPEYGWVPLKIVSDSPPFKMAAVTKDRNFFNYSLLL